MNMTDGLYAEEEDSLHGRYLSFTIGEDVFGVSIRFVTEILGVQSITRVPETPDFIKGIINLRGKIIPIVDVRLKFGKPEAAYTERTCIIVTEANGMAVGLVVDKVDDVLTIPDEDLASAPSGGLGFDVMYIEGVGNVNGDALLLLDLERFLRPDEASAASRAAEAGEAVEAGRSNSPDAAGGPVDSPYGAGAANSGAGAGEV
jgi:purine-binding chemotaxis protein CheW